MNLEILSGGAANGMVNAVRAQFLEETGMEIAGDFGAVGGMRERFRGGEAADVLILTRAIIDQFADEGLVDAGSVADLGRVVTGVARRAGSPATDVSTPDALRNALLDADAIYFPDPEKATAGIHFARVMERLGVLEPARDRLRRFPNGQTAMAAMAAGSDANPIGCTQITEILNSPGVDYVGDLPADLGLSTTYTAAVAAHAMHPEAAARLVAMLTSPDLAERRRRIGFQP